MSLLDDDFELNLEDILESGLRQLLKKCRDKIYTSDIYIALFDDVEKAEINIIPFEPNESGVYYVGIDYLCLNGKERFNIKLFDPKYVVVQPQRTIIMENLNHRYTFYGIDPAPSYKTYSAAGRIGNYKIISTSNGWIKFTLEEIMSGTIGETIKITNYSRKV